YMLKKISKLGDSIELEQRTIIMFDMISVIAFSGEDPYIKVESAFEDIRILLKMQSLAIKKCSGLEYEMWEKVKNELGKLNMRKLEYDYPEGVKKFVIEKDQKICDLCEKFILGEENCILIEEVALTPCIVASEE
ncbi:39770_t:CDS:2, partial [Gigaspora margarita]